MTDHDPMYWSEHDRLKHRIGDLVLLEKVAEEAGCSAESITEVRREREAAVAVALSIADQRTAELRAELEREGEHDGS